MKYCRCCWNIFKKKRKSKGGLTGVVHGDNDAASVPAWLRGVERFDDIAHNEAKRGRVWLRESVGTGRGKCMNSS